MMKSSKISASAESYLESLQKETKKLLNQKQNETLQRSNDKQTNIFKKKLENKKNKYLNEFTNLSDINSSFDSEVIIETSGKSKKKNSKSNLCNITKDKDSLVSFTSDESLSNQTINDNKVNEDLLDSNRYSIASIPAEKYFKMIRYSIDTSLFVGTKNDNNSNEISPLSSKSTNTNSFSHEQSNQNNKKDIGNKKQDSNANLLSKQTKSNFKIGNLVSKTERQETIMELDDIIHNNVENKEKSNKKNPILPISAFRKQSISTTKSAAEKNYNLSKKNKEKSLSSASSAITSEINSVVKQTSESASSSISTIKSKDKAFKKQNISNSTSISSFLSSTKVNSSMSESTSDSTTNTSFTSTSTNLSESSTYSSESISESSTISSDSTLKTITKNESTKQMNNKLDSYDELSSIISELKENPNDNDLNYSFQASNRSSSQSFYSISEKNFEDQTIGNYLIIEKMGSLYSQNLFKNIQIEIVKHQSKLSLLSSNKHLKHNKNDVLKNIVFPYFDNIKKYIVKEKELSDLIEKNLYSVFCKDSTEKAIKNIFSQ